ncbi:hypothetical protein [Micromonospora chersina]|nr:hypothetical protein [Micromonospora chersina]
MRLILSGCSASRARLSHQHLAAASVRVPVATPAWATPPVPI